MGIPPLATLPADLLVVADTADEIADFGCEARPPSPATGSGRCAPTIVDDEIAALVIPAFAQTFAERRGDVRTGLRRARLEEADDRSDRLLCGPLARTKRR